MGKWNIIPEATCRYCGKKFVPAIEHALRDSKGYYCKPTCFLHRDELNVRKSKKVLMMRGDEVMEVFRCASVAARCVCGEPKLVRDACRNGTKYRGYTWKYEE